MDIGIRIRRKDMEIKENTQKKTRLHYQGNTGEKVTKCCLCGMPIEGWGNNPAPIRERGRCCDDCNSNIIIPLRILALTRKH